MADCPLVYVLAGVAKLLDGSNDNTLELVTPNRIQLVDLLILLDGKLCEISHKTLSGLSVLFCLEPIVLHLLLSIFL